MEEGRHLEGILALPKQRKGEDSASEHWGGGGDGNEKMIRE